MAIRRTSRTALRAAIAAAAVALGGTGHPVVRRSRKADLSADV